MLGDLLHIFRWWLYILLFGVLFLPVTEKSFRGFFDRGYSFSKVIAIIVVSYTTWLLSSLGVISFAYSSCLAVFFAVAAVIYLTSGGFSLKAYLQEYKRIILFEEMLFLAILLIWSYIRGLQPDIYGLEKFMDFGFVNAIIRAPHMPPADIWFAGNTINYYYFGHFTCAYLAVITRIDPAVAYNLMIATLTALSFVLTFSISGNLLFLLRKYNMRRVILAGLISASLLTFGGNLHGFIYGHAKLLPSESEYYYPQSTRYIGYNAPTDDKTIHEFPIYSFVVSDLHGHVSDIPAVLTFTALLISMFFAGEGRTLSYRSKLLPDGFLPAAIRAFAAPEGKTALLSLLLAAMYMTNTWDYPIYITVMLITLFYFNLGAAAKPLTRTLLQAAAAIAVSQLMVLPFTLKFHNISNGVGLAHYHTPLYQLLVLWGHQLFFVLCFIVFLAPEAYKRFKGISGSGSHTLNPSENIAGHSRFKESRLKELLKSLPVPDVLCLILSFCAIGLVIMPEIVFVRDIYFKGYHRANTMFKLTYQAFMLFAIAIGYITVRLVSQTGSKSFRYTLALVFTVMYLLPMSYLPLAVQGYYGSLTPHRYKGLYGLSFLQTKHPGDYEAVKWLNENVKGQPTILEAHGDSYTIYCRISAATGLPTVQGWFVHEWLWRNDREEPLQRGKEVEIIYQSEDLDKTLELIDKYDIKYIIIGDLERQKFPDLNEEKLLSLGEVVFSSQGTEIIYIQ